MILLLQLIIHTCSRPLFILSREFAMTDLGSLHHFLGGNRSPIDTTSKLSATDDALLPDGTSYRTLTRALQYLTFTRSDITYVVQRVCLLMLAPHDSHFALMKRILRYLSGTIDFGLWLVPSSVTSLTTYSDVGWGGYPNSRRSTSGYYVFLGDNLLSWSSK